MKRKTNIQSDNSFFNRKKSGIESACPTINFSHTNNSNSFKYPIQNNISKTNKNLKKNDNSSILQFLQGSKMKDKEIPTSNSQADTLQAQIEKERLEAIRIKNLLLVNKCLNVKLKEKENFNKMFRNHRENFGTMIFPFVIKTMLGIFRGSEIKITSSQKYLSCKLHTNENITDECIKLSVEDDRIIGFISKDISIILKELIKLNCLDIDILFDQERKEIFIIVSFSNLLIYTTNVEYIGFSDLSLGGNKNILYRFKSSFLIPIETVKSLNELYFSSKCLNSKLEIFENPQGDKCIRAKSDSILGIDDYVKIIKEYLKLSKKYENHLGIEINQIMISNQSEMPELRKIRSSIAIDNNINNSEDVNKLYISVQPNFINVQSNPLSENFNLNSNISLNNMKEENKIIKSNEKDSTNYTISQNDENLHNDNKKEDEDLDNSSDNEDEKKNSSYNQFLLMNIEYIISTANSFSYLFHPYELKHVDVYSELNELEKELLSKFLTRTSIWISVERMQKYFSKQNQEIKDSIKKLTDLSLIKNSRKLFEEIFAKETYKIDYKSEVFTFLYYLTNYDLKSIQYELNKLTKNCHKVSKESFPCDEIFVNNSFFRLHNYFDFNLFKEFSEFSSVEITKHNFSLKNNNDDNKTSKTNTKSAATPMQKGNMKYITNFLNASNYRKVKITKFEFSVKMSMIFDIIKSIDLYFTDKSSSIIEKFLSLKNTNNISNGFRSDKQEKILKIFSNYDFLTLNQTFAKVFDTATRLFFFYSDYRDINDVAKQFYGYENFERFENFVTNNQNLKENKSYLRPIFTNIKDFKLYDNLYQMKNAYIINSMIFNNHELNFKLGINLCFNLLVLTNPSLSKLIFPESEFKYLHQEMNLENESKYSFKHDEIENIVKQIESEGNDEQSFLEKTTNLLLSSNFQFVDESFLTKFKHGHIAAEILHYLAETCEKLKRYKLAAFIFSFLLLGSHLYKKRGNWWHRLILIFNVHLKKKSLCVRLLNKTAEDIFIKSGNLVKIKKYFEMFQKEKEKYLTKISQQDIESKKKKSKKLILNEKSYLDELDINGDNITKINTEIYDENLFKEKVRKIQADSVVSKYSGRRLYSNDSNWLVTVEEYAISYYNKLSYSGIHGENVILPALYNIFFWDVFFYDKIPFVFQSPYQNFPLDLFSSDFYKSRREMIDKKIQEISEFSDKDVKDYFEYIFSKKKFIKSVFIDWNSIYNKKDVLLKISLAIGPKKLAPCFLEFAKNLRFMLKGMPDLFLWKEDGNSGLADEVIRGSALIVEVKSRNDKLSDYQKYWLHFLTKIEVNVEVLHVE